MAGIDAVCFCTRPQLPSVKPMTASTFTRHLGLLFPDTLPFSGFFAPVRIEADIYDLEVDGEIPADLNGAFYRNGADAQYPPLLGDDIYLNGDGMVTMLRFNDGHADLKSRFVRTERFIAERRARRSLSGAYRNPFTDEPGMPGIGTGTANTSVYWHGGKLLALKEADQPYELDPMTLQTRGRYDFDGQLRSATFTAHPKTDPVTGDLIAFAYNTRGRPDRDVVCYVISPGGEIVREEWFEAPYPSMMHDYLVSQDYIVFHISPMIADWERLKAGVPFFQWDPGQESMVGVIPRRQGVSGIRWFSSPSVMQTHTINAFNTGDQLTIDHFVAASGWLSQFPDANGLITEEKPPIAQRWTFDLASGSDSFECRTLVELPGDMPRVDPRTLTRRNRHMWMGALDLTLGPMVELGPMGPPFNCIVHLDHETGRRQHFYPGPDNAPEEPVFVPRGSSSTEGDGYLICVVGRRRENRSDVVILDALRLSDGPLATIRVPYRLRYAFHGTWAPAEELPW